MDGFEILEKLGDGAYSVVYKVKRKQDNKIYALKKVSLENLSDKEKENSLNEVRILASVKSTFVISYKEAFIDEPSQSLCIVMEYADKGDLYQKIVQFKKMGCLIEEVDVWRIFIQMTRGLKALHDLKILHRDLKSANIFLFSDGSAKIGDLNVSKVAHKGLGYTQTGTPYYASPEVWRDEPYDTKSDIWSLACVTYEMLALHPPFMAADMEGLFNKVSKCQYGKICNKYSNDISEILKLLFKVNSKERPSCAQILKHPLIKKRLEFFKAEAGYENEDLDSMEEGVLLRTIRIPKNILCLSDKLPEPNYDDSNVHKVSKDKKEKSSLINKINTFPNSSLPDINMKINRTNKSSSPNVLEEAEKVSKTGDIVVQNVKKEKKKKIINIKTVENNNENNNINLQTHKKYQKNKYGNVRMKEIQKYFNDLGINENYKLYIPQLDMGNNKIGNINNNIGNERRKIHKYGNLPHLYRNNITKKNISNSLNHYDRINNSPSPKIIPNKRLNSIVNKKLGIKII